MAKQSGQHAVLGASRAERQDSSHVSRTDQKRQTGITIQLMAYRDTLSLLMSSADSITKASQEQEQ